MLQEGDTVPDFTLKVATAEGIKDFRLREALGKGPIVLNFFPAAFTAPCTQQMCDIRDAYGDLEGAGAQVLGFSADTPHSNQAFIKEHDLKQGILSDPDREVLPDVWDTQEVAGMKGRAKRGVMVVDPEGTVQYVWQTDDPGNTPDVGEIRDAVQGVAAPA